MQNGETDLLRVVDLKIRINNLRVGIDVVKGVSFRVPRGRTVALVGESGSGKSIIAQSILGILPNVAHVSGGSILFDDPVISPTPLDIAELDPTGPDIRKLRGGRISMIFQEPMTSLSPVYTIGNQIEEALLLHRTIEAGGARAMTEAMLDDVGFPHPQRAYDMYPFELSGGLRQRAMIAMALICHPALLIADEPTTALDVTIQAQVLAVLKRLQAKLDMSMLLITHDLGVVANMADEVVVIYHGEIMEAGPCRELLENPAHAYLKGLLAAVPTMSMKPGDKLKALREVESELPESMKGRKLPPPDPDAPPLLAVRGLAKTFVSTKGAGFFKASQTGQVRAVRDVSFEIERGECFGLVGESGCGKSTISKMISRAVSPDSGKILFCTEAGKEIDVGQLSGQALTRFRPHIQMVFQDPFSSLSPRSTVKNILSEPLEIHGRGNQAWRETRVRELLQMVGLPLSSLNRYPHSFSGGQRQRIGIARALALEPDLLICDEPVSALDVSVQAQILNLIARLKSELGLTTIFISHNLAVVNYIADRIAVMYKGRIVEIAPRGVVFEAPVHPYTRTLIQAIPTVEFDRLIDFDHLFSPTEDGTSGWAPPFMETDSAEDAMHYVTVGPEHLVLVRREVHAEDLAAYAANPPA